MRKRLRPTFFEHLDGHYAPQSAGASSGRALYKAPKARRKGVIDMSIPQFVVLAMFFILLACVATGATAYGVVAVAGEGPSGPQGMQGVTGAGGAKGAQGLQGTAGNDASREAIKRLAGLFAVQQSSAIQGGAQVSFNDPEIGACVQYVLTGEPGVEACPGFFAASDNTTSDTSGDTPSEAN